MQTDFRLGDWVIRPRRECIERGDVVVHVHPKSMNVLLRLAAAGGEVVSREELFESVWPGVVVTDDALTQCVVELRKAFGDSARRPRVIRTVPKVGFCLVQPVTGLDDEPARPDTPRINLVFAVLAAVIIALALFGIFRTGDEPLDSGAAAEGASIIVLPFLNMSSDPEQAYFSDGISEELLNLLAKIPDLRVISQTSAFSFKEKDVDVSAIARQLNVSHVLEGSIRQADDRVRITAQLIDARTDSHLWSQTYDRDFSEIFTIQDEIARNVVDEIESILTKDYPHSRQVDPEAYRLYLIGKHHLNTYAVGKALPYFLQAVEIDRQYTEAHLGIAYSYGVMTFLGFMPPREGYARIKAEIAAMLETDEEIPRIHRQIAGMNFYFDWDWERAEKRFQTAIEQAPGDAHVYQTFTFFLTAMGRTLEAETLVERALVLEPIAPSMYQAASHVYYFSGQYEKSIVYCRSALELSPGNSLVLSEQGWNELQLGRFEQAVGHMEKAAMLAPDNVQNLWTLAHAYAVTGEETKARAMLADLHALAEQRYVMPFAFAMIHAGLGEKQLAIDWLERAYEDRNGWMVYLHQAPRLDPLREEPRFQDLLARMNFPD